MLAIFEEYIHIVLVIIAIVSVMYLSVFAIFIYNIAKDVFKDK